MNAPPASFLPYGHQHIEDDDIAAVVSALRGDYLTTGPTVDRFEAALAEACGGPYAVVCSNGTAALHLAAMGLGLGEGHLAFVPSVTFVATANAGRYVGAEVVFTDVDPHSGLMRPQDLQQALDRMPNARGAVLPVHLNGQCVDLEAIAGIARAHNLKVVEDACHAIGGSTMQRGRSVPVGGSDLSDACVFSFHPVKTITMGEGGAITTRHEELARRMRRLRSHGIERQAGEFVQGELGFDASGSPNPWYYELQDLGFNYRATDFQCALGISQLAKLRRFVELRHSLCAHYDERLAALTPVLRPIARPSASATAWHLYAVLIEFETLSVTRAGLMSWLRDRGIGTQVHYIPVHRQPYYRERYGEQHLPGADHYYARVMSLPLYPAMGAEDVDRVADCLAEALHLFRAKG